MIQGVSSIVIHSIVEDIKKYPHLIASALLIYKFPPSLQQMINLLADDLESLNAFHGVETYKQNKQNKSDNSLKKNDYQSYPLFRIETLFTLNRESVRGQLGF